MIIIVTLFFIASTLIIINFAAYCENRETIGVVSSRNLTGEIFNFAFRLFIIEFLSSIEYTVTMFCYGCVYAGSENLTWHLFSHTIFPKPNLIIMVISLLLLLLFFCAYIVSDLNYKGVNLRIIDLLMPFIGVFYYIYVSIKNKINHYLQRKKLKRDAKKKNKKTKIMRSLLGFDTAIDDMVITSNEGKKLLSVINDDLIPKYNQLIELSKQANELESNDTLTQLEDSKEKLQTKIKKLALTIKDCELEKDREKLKKKANLLIKSLD